MIKYNGTAANRQVNFTMIPNELIDFVNLRPGELMIYIILLRHDYHDKKTKTRKHYCYPTMATLKRKSGMSYDKIYESLYILDKAGLVTKGSMMRYNKDGSESKLSRNIYFLNLVDFTDKKNISEINERVTNSRMQYKKGEVIKQYSVGRKIIDIDGSKVYIPESGMINIPQAGSEKDELNPYRRIDEDSPPTPSLQEGADGLNMAVGISEYPDGNHSMKVKTLKVELFPDILKVVQAYYPIRKHDFHKLIQYRDKVNTIREAIKIHGDDLFKAIELYQTILKDPDRYFWKYRWDLWEFCRRGVDRFLESSNPLENFKKEIRKSREEELDEWIRKECMS